MIKGDITTDGRIIGWRLEEPYNQYYDGIKVFHCNQRQWLYWLMLLIGLGFCQPNIQSLSIFGWQGKSDLHMRKEHILYQLKGVWVQLPDALLAS